MGKLAWFWLSVRLQSVTCHVDHQGASSLILIFSTNGNCENVSYVKKQSHGFDWSCQRWSHACDWPIKTPAVCNRSLDSHLMWTTSGKACLILIEHDYKVRNRGRRSFKSGRCKAHWFWFLVQIQTEEMWPPIRGVEILCRSLAVRWLAAAVIQHVLAQVLDWLKYWCDAFDIRDLEHCNLFDYAQQTWLCAWMCDVVNRLCI